MIERLGLFFYYCDCQLEEAVAEEFDAVVKEDNLLMKSDLPEKPRSPQEYVQACRVKLWLHAFPSLLRSKSTFSRSKAFKDHKYIDLAVKRVVWR